MSYSKAEDRKDAKTLPLSTNSEARALNWPTASEEGKKMAQKHPFAFEVYNGRGERTWYLDAGSIQKRDVWIKALNDAVARMRGPMQASSLPPPAPAAAQLLGPAPSRIATQQPPPAVTQAPEPGPRTAPAAAPTQPAAWGIVEKGVPDWCN